jgi:UDP-glucose 4-epimerase
MAYEKIAVTGGAGLLGSHVMRRLAGKARLTSIDRKPPIEGNAALGNHIDASITDFEAMKAAFRGQDAVIHLAAIPNPREATAELTFSNNVHGAWTVFEVNEAHPIRPTEVYSLSKKVTEAIAESYAARKALEVTAIRPSHILFPRGYGEIEARGADPQNYHFWAWVDPEDVAQSFDLAINTSRYDGFEIFTITAAEGLNLRPTLQMAAERWGKLPTLQRPEVYEKLATASVLDITKAREKLGYEPVVDRAALTEKARPPIQS